jgi:drug/metabolite transporter (DMT)-like permease
LGVTRFFETAALTLLALIAFASNSILTRMALGGRLIDAFSFTSVRLAAGAAMLVVLVRLRSGSWAPLRGSGQGGGRGWTGPLALFGYAAPFTLAYVRIGAASGALILFGAVQLTMIGWGIAHGERPAARAWLGLVLAIGGLAWLMLPSVSRPDVLGTALMVVAGMAWGAYSIAGRGTGDLIAANARSFLLATPLALALSLVAEVAATRESSAPGVVLAVASGAVTSGLGYAIWYRAQRGLTVMQAAIVQLAVPIIAAVGAVAFLHERPTVRLVQAGALVLGGLTLALSAPRRRA